MSAQDLLELKARAFDDLMAVLDGKERFVRSYARVVELPRLSFPMADMTNATVRTERVDVYEWVLRYPGRSDLKQTLLDDAAKALK